MPQLDAIPPETPSLDAEGSAETPTPEPTATDPAAEIASYRKRQAGAEAARQTAEAKLRDAETELAAFRAKDQTAAEKDLTEQTRLEERLKVAETRAAEAEQKAEGRVLDAKYPNARKELPEVTDEVRLAKFEAMLSEEDGPTTPTPRGNNGPRDVAPPAEETSETIFKRLKTLPVPW